MIRVILTGSTGYLGRHVAEALRRQEYDVYSVLNPSTASALDQKSLWNDSDLESNIKKLNPDLLVHVAAAYHGSDDIINVNVLLPVKLLNAVSELGKKPPRLVTVGSYWQDGNASRPRVPIDLYSSAKQSLTTFIEHYKTYHQAKCVELILTGIYGPADPRRKILDTLLGQLNSNNRLKLSPGRQEINLIHVRDVTRAVVVAAALVLDGREGRYSVASKKTLKLRDLACLIEKLSGRELNVDWKGKYRARELMEINLESPCLPGWREIESLEKYIIHASQQI